ncbi:GDSL-type esterase/lipase family protein [Paenibacillus paeoniae]|uniref:GDSL family lipase n=1 Tax=Paenibacillus paeoniae TaxID=2292705 RepID=A0A371PN13_9BACL|nr:GDSL-type esterase/lipase family protein [Paenibacillus paeoniae]REK77187.1 GDSL family lipase [Paenibacillus paeoniae]
MKTTRWLWYWLAACSLLSTVVLLTGLGMVLNDLKAVPAVSETKPSPSAPSETTSEERVSLGNFKEIRIVALGDSLTKGTGDATGKGYVRQVVDGLKKEFDKPVQLLNNLALNGMQTSQLGERLSNDSGYQYAVKSANLILFSIGGNDLFLSARARMEKKEWAMLGMDELEQDMEETLGRFRSIIDQLYELNPSAKIVYMGLYNPFYDLDNLRIASLNMQQWNKEAYAVIHPYPNMMMVPTFDLFEGRIGEYLSSDHFHPNHEGYKRIAGRMLEALD